MSDTVQDALGTQLSAGTDMTPSDAQALGDAFQMAIIQGGVFQMGTLISDTAEAIQDSSSDPDAPF